MAHAHAIRRNLDALLERNDFPADAFFVNRVFRGRPIVVYGAGESFHYFKEVVIRGHGYTPSLIIDRKFAPGDCFEGVPACSPLDCRDRAAALANAIAVICLGQQRYYGEIVETLRTIGLHDVIGLRDIYEIHNPFNEPSELAERGFAFYRDRRDQVLGAFDLLADDRSRDVFEACIETHVTRRPVPVPMDERGEQYTPKSVPLRKGHSRYIYCGVSVGEMARVFSQVGPVEACACFEPDPNQFRETAAFLEAHHHEVGRRVTALPCAVYVDDAVRPFTFSDTSFGSRVVASGPTWAQCVAIDHALPGFRPTFIGMDIEGAELNALKGARATLCDEAPDLAVCVYHSPADLWEIPLFLHGLGLGYRFYLRNYTSLVGETVLYATAQ